LLQLLHLCHLPSEVFLVLLQLIFGLFFLPFSFLLLLQQTRLVRDPIIYIILVQLPDIVFLNSEVLIFFPSQIKQVKYVVQLIVSVLGMLLESFQLKIYFESFKTTNVAI